MYRRLICILVLLGSLVPIASGADDPAPKITEITLTRSGNDRGTGPQDVLTLRADGSAALIGKKNVERIGSFAGEIPDNGNSPSFPLLAAMYESLRGQRGSTGKPASELTAINWHIVRGGKVEELEDFCPGLDPALWAFEMAVRGVAADIKWKKSDEAKAPEVELKLAPSSAAPDESVLAALSASAWSRTGMINILGAGSSQVLRFTRQKEQLNVESIWHSFKNVSEQQKDNPADPVETFACEVRGPVLFMNGRPQTIALIDGKQLVMNALTPAGGRDWYYAAALRTPAGTAARAEEYLFSFTDDPLKSDAGKGSMRARIGDNPPRSIDVQFALTRAEAGLRYFDVTAEGPKGPAVRTRIALSADGKYGLMLDNLNLNSEVFTSK